MNGKLIDDANKLITHNLWELEFGIDKMDNSMVSGEKMSD